ncbi:alpha/beta hydrolase [Myxococcus sp. RHSTA-1-4]|uniref:alpha/beta hydrolase n=1 Tax=Myxococcus sp. RHSTA-1-4 TaxID=2874601 RepID=UPI001CBE313A|nr:alpha/beta fold hydrolase [Myxococcus sp. RHSTA-1-4]MBZ4415577.1 alpha/beta hydrolase [Myxococcus sp. RHSTA-1-4]
MRLPDWRSAATPGPPIPTVDEVDFRALYSKTKYVVETADGWSLVITRYRPVKQPFPQPLFGEPLLLVHGFSQNRHTWTSGQFVKNLLFFGVDIHILELRGHGKSSIEFQKERAERFKRPLPPDLDYGWDIDSYFLYDLPAAVSGVKRITRRERIFFCGHSMGGMLGYGYAGIHNDFEGLITIGSPADLGRGFMLLRVLAHGAPLLASLIDLTLTGLNVGGQVEGVSRKLLARGVGALNAGLGRKLTPEERRALRFKAVPVDLILKFVERQLGKAEDSPLYQQLTTRLNRLINPERVSADDIRWLLREGGEREPRRVLEQFAKWIRRGEMVCYRTGFDFKRGFGRIEVPMAIIFGDLDPLASLESTRSVYRAAKSEYLLWRPVKGNSHIELTMGHDIRQICYDIKNLIEYARTHRNRPPSLPRLR